MLLLTTWTGASHAADLITCTEPGAAEMVMHVGGGCDDVGPDDHKTDPQHHDGCHGQHVSAPAIGPLIQAPLPAVSTYGFGATHAVLASELDSALRPPRA
jgi:hypothetical protein